jgi:hypothetical protein
MMYYNKINYGEGCKSLCFPDPLQSSHTFYGGTLKHILENT